MVNIGVISYSITAVSFGILSLLLLTSWRGRLQGALLVSASIMTMIWSVSVAINAWQAKEKCGLVHQIVAGDSTKSYQTDYTVGIEVPA